MSDNGNGAVVTRTGMVRSWRLEKGFGFIASGVDHDIFLHVSQVVAGNVRDLAVGSHVEFVAAEDQRKRGLYARNVKVFR